MWIWRPWTPEEESIKPLEDDHMSRMTRLNNNTLDLLRAVPRHPAFSEAVKGLTIQAYAWSGGDEMYDEGSLIAALQTLHNLRTFHWYGERPMLSSAVLEALDIGSSATLEDLHIPMLQYTATILPPMDFPCLKALSVVFADSAAEVELDACDWDAVNRLLDTVAPALTRLSISGDAVWRRESFGSFLTLRELELIYINTFSGFHNILRHCGTVTSLTILPAFSSHPDAMFTALDTCPNTLPGLTAFKYLNHMMVEIVEDHHIHALCKFLRHKRLMRRLDVWFDGDEKMDAPLLELLPSLPALEVLGFDFMRYDWLPEDIPSFDWAIPARISALSLHPDACALYAPYKEAWLKLFESRASLRYLHIFETIVTVRPPRTSDDLGLHFHPLSAEELPSSLELFGYGVYLRPIVREPVPAPEPGSGSGPSIDSTRQTFGPCWSREKVTFRTEQDFGCSDWEWLLRWHDYDGLGGLRPGVLKNGV